MPSDSIVIERRFRGPPESGNGGYVSGLLAGFVGSGATVRLRVPPPLEVPLQVERTDDGVHLRNGSELIAEARVTPLEIEVPPAPTFAEAEVASKSYRGLEGHWCPGCFVCGPERETGDGLRIFPGEVGEGGVVCAPWVPDENLASDGGVVNPEFVWAALDCPGPMAFESFWSQTMLLGEMTASLESSVHVGQKYVVVGWPIGERGRLHFVGTAIFSEEGRCGVARATWLTPKGG